MTPSKFRWKIGRVGLGWSEVEGQGGGGADICFSFKNKHLIIYFFNFFVELNITFLIPMFVAFLETQELRCFDGDTCACELISRRPLPDVGS